jgi:outer membrane lipoprotein carrier protein
MKFTRKYIAKIMLTAAALLWTTTGICGADQLDNIKKAYSEVKTIEAQFSQKITISALKRQRELKGEFYYKRGKGFLWKYTAPKEKVFLYDGSAVWQAEEDKSYVIKEKMDKEKMEGNFLDLVDDVTHLDKHFLVKSASKQDDMEVLQLTPKKEGGLQSARLWIDDKALISKIELTEITGNVNIIDFSSTKINKPVSDTTFVFKPGNRQVEER